MKITIDKLTELKACQTGKNWFMAKFSEEVECETLIQACIDDNRVNYASWIIVNLLSCKMCLRYVSFVAEQIFPDYKERNENIANYQIDDVVGWEKWVKHEASRATYFVTKSSQELSSKIIRHGLKLLNEEWR